MSEQIAEPLYDLVITGATVLTGAPASHVIENAVVAIAQGRFARVEAATKDAAPLRARRSLHLSGRVITPGLVNVHTHANLSMVRGVAEDLGFAPAYTPGIPQGHMVTPDEAYAIARLGALEALLFGSTLINDTFVHADIVTPAMAEIGLRVWSCGRIHDVDFSGVSVGRWDYVDAIGDRTLNEAIALAERFESKSNGRIGVQLAAHAPDTCSTPFLRRIARAAEETGLRVTTHLSQSKVELARIRERDGMSPPELLDEVGLLNDRLTAAHCIHVTDSDIARIGRAGIHVAHIAKGNATGATIAPTHRLRAAGAKLALGTDNMHADMVEVMRWALCVGRIQLGAVTPDWQPETVFEMATMAGARAMGLEDQIGSIEVGKRADFVAFDFRRPHLTPATNALGNLVHVAQGRDVEIVAVDGELMVEDGKPTRVDADAVRRDAALAIDALWKRARGN
ncbi:amidohydrolase family protein [Ancylobacter defluvii]|uniref:5-methylthioadenosine/S-adenosylhomocysteine deaminase n=1 Tax=Ancylobacter defluvii TaxID=1282440 RepID=A0A9W6NDN3_9HYPH|nr:amidohydrolase family protein [Ancylobacter defluvii]MBS7589766.1 amidohydrolase family protein [Ancylobacter defluvii]GLK86875.1 5-methylthioadenosine/S-adenosylhomocysteine deaminase [Ancylobacter defluvii]